MIYVLVYRRFDYHRFDDVLTASTDLGILVDRLPKDKEDLTIYSENSDKYKEEYQTLAFNEVSHFVIMEFLE